MKRDNKNMKPKKRLIKFQRGFSLAEMLVASTVMAVVVTGAMSMQNYTMTRTTGTSDKAFATQKAMQMFEELRAYVQANRETDIAKLQNFSDGANYNYVLTTEKKTGSSSMGSTATDLSNPGDSLSGNSVLTNSGGTQIWKFVRQVQIKPVPNDTNARYVSVSVWLADRSNPNQPASARPLATISGLLKTNISNEPPTQVYDLFVLGMENAPSWWVDLADLKPSFDRTLVDLEQRNPGLVFRRHYISRYGFGRDPYYMPYINDAANISAQDLPWTYLYPGKTADNRSLGESYVLDGINGRRRTDSDNFSIDKANTNYGVGSPYRQYSMADQFNHVMRYPEQKAMEARLTQEDPDTFKDNPTLTSFLEDLNTPDINGNYKYKNSIIVNLHGELLPLPAIRNYSDPAKSPSNFSRKLDGNPLATVLPAQGSDNTDFTSLRNKRVVSHPENLRYNNGGNVTWRVYAYEEIQPGLTGLNTTATNFSDNIGDANCNAGTSSCRGDDTIPKISLFIPTIGKGPSYKGADDAGFLDYPTNSSGTGFTPSIPSTNTFNISRLVGNDNKVYKWWTQTSTGIEQLTQYHEFFQNISGSMEMSLRSIFINNTSPANLTSYGGINYNTKNISSRSVPINSTVRMGSTAIDLVAPMSAADAEDLAGNLIVLDGGTENEEVARVVSIVNVPNNGGTSGMNSNAQNRLNGVNKLRRLNLAHALRLNHDTVQPLPGNTALSTAAQATLTTEVTAMLTELVSASVATPTRVGGAISTSTTPVLPPITKHKDYEIQTVDDTMFGHPERGFRVYLYDTPTRMAQNNTNCANCSVSNTGLAADQQLDGLEYIPAPMGSDFSLDAANNVATNFATLYKNTARWKVGFDTGTFGGAASTNPFWNDSTQRHVLPLETRITDYQATLATGCNSNLAELCEGIWGDGDAYVPNFSTSTTEHNTQMRPNLSNISRTYVYINHKFTDVSDTSILGTPASLMNTIPAGTLTIPKTEQFQYMGDPRWEPYLDTKRLHRYNRHYINLSGGGSGMSGYDRASGIAWDNDDVDLNWLFHLYSNGIMRSNSVYNSISGFSNYYYANGGELGTDGTNATFSVRTQPWNQTDTGTATTGNDQNAVREIINNGTRVMMSTDATTPGGASERWRMRPYFNEMYPDDLADFWQANGNLPSLDYTSANNLLGVSATSPTMRFFRNVSTDVPRSRPYTHRRISSQGAPSFMNGNGNTNPPSSTNGLEHISVGGNALLTNGVGDAGKQLVEAFNLILADSLPSTRPFILTGNSGNGGYNTTEIQSLRNRLQFVNTTTGAVSSTLSTQNVYYRHDSAPTTRVASSMIKLTRPDPSSPGNVASDVSGMVGYVLMNGLENAAGTGVQDMARFAQAGSLQTYMDAGDRSIPGNASGRSVQLPRVKISDPRSSVIYNNPSTIPVNFNVSWLRWDDQKFSPAYPVGWYDSTRLVYNIKYSKDNKLNWIYAGTNVNVVTGAGIQYYDHFNPSYSVAGGPETITGGSLDKTYNWDVSGLPAGNYVLRVETFREGFSTGWSYHDVFLTIER